MAKKATNIIKSVFSEAREATAKKATMPRKPIISSPVLEPKSSSTINLDPLINTNTRASQGLSITHPVPEQNIGPRRNLQQKPEVEIKKSKEWQKADRIREVNRGIDGKIANHVAAGAEAPKSTAFDSAKQVGKNMYNNIRETGFADGDYLGSALTGALAMGAVSGTTEWANGGSFTGGFKDGLVNGALLGAGTKGIKVGAYGKRHAGQSLTDSFGRINRDYGLNQYQKKSKALKALETNAAASKLNVMNKK